MKVSTFLFSLLLLVCTCGCTPDVETTDAVTSVTSVEQDTIAYGQLLCSDSAKHDMGTVYTFTHEATRVMILVTVDIPVRDVVDILLQQHIVITPRSLVRVVVEERSDMIALQRGYGVVRVFEYQTKEYSLLIFSGGVAQPEFQSKQKLK